MAWCRVRLVSCKPPVEQNAAWQCAACLQIPTLQSLPVSKDQCSGGDLAVAESAYCLRMIHYQRGDLDEAPEMLKETISLTCDVNAAEACKVEVAEAQLVKAYRGGLKVLESSS